jgi:predicted alpha/beta superfamily hydrolase
MRPIIKAACFCLIASISSSSYALQKVHVVVHIPTDTPKTDSIYLAGSLPSVGSWKPDGLKLTRQDDGTYTTDVELPTGQALEFKITRGSWTTVEKNADGSDRPNRQVAINVATKQIDATVERWASDALNRTAESTVVGTLKLHTIDSRFLKQPRAIRVWLPPGYDSNANERYSVLYMHDGQNCFNRQTSAFGNEWEIDESLTKLVADKRIPPIIVVGVDNGLANRINELTYNADAKRGGGQGNAYADFLLNEVKPFVEKSYRTKPDRRHTFIGGSSLGGLASLEIARRHPDTFGGVIAMSPTIWWADESLLKEIDRDPNSLAHTRVWIDMGTR